MDIVTILYFFLYLLIGAGVVWLIIWIISLMLEAMGRPFPQVIKNIIWAIFLLIVLIYCVQHFFYGGTSIGLPHRR